MLFRSWVGRGVRKPEAEVAADVPAADAPVAGGSNQPTQVSPGELDYSKLLDAEGRPDAARTAAVSAACHQRGVVTLTCGTWGNVFRFLPPLSISDELLAEAFDVVAEAFAATA